MEASLINPGVSILLWHDLFSTNKIFYSRVFFHFGPSFQPNVGGHWEVMFSYVCVCTSVWVSVLLYVVSLDMFLDFIYELGGLSVSQLF